ncbi:hypothetical protein CHARACLAT_024817 [Characodon lateralis]|uniref:Uncharacterized protein n=1 Tax=Characodon lateralis TaxID=208331 RepID=A0ABU7D0K5_9TELE|nr:hypothetical protein [Characodon lateralis]
MDPEKTLTFCLGLQADERTMSLQELVSPKATTVSLREIDSSTVDEVRLFFRFNLCTSSALSDLLTLRPQTSVYFIKISCDKP